MFQRLIRRFPALRRVGSSERGSMPVIRQLTAMECGAACLRIVLAFYGKEVPAEEVRAVVGVSRDGCTAWDIIDGARRFGLRGRGVQADLPDLPKLPRGSILHWDFKHFVVFDRLRRGFVEIVDPGFGRRRLSLEDFSKSFTGIAIVLEVSTNFATGGVKRPVWRNMVRVLGRSGNWYRVLSISVLLQLFMLGIPLLTGTLVDRVLPEGDYSLLFVMSIGMAVLVVFYFLSSVVRGYLLIHIRTLFDVQMTLGFLGHLMDLPYLFFQQRPAGDLMMRLNSNATIREILTSGAVTALLDGCMVSFYLLLILALDRPIALLVFGLAGAQILLFVLTRRRQRDLMSQSLQIQARSQSYLVELMSAMEMLKAMGREPQASERWSRMFVNMLNNSIDRSRLTALVEAASGTLKFVAPLAVLALGGFRVLTGHLGPGEMLGIVAISSGFLTPIANLVFTALSFQLLGSYVERIDDVFRAAPEQTEGPRHILRIKGNITVDRVYFAYGPHSRMVLNHVSVEVRQGQLVAIVGRSGCGKTTLANIMLGLYNPLSGSIRYDDIDLKMLDLRSLRRQLGIVTQRVQLFGTSIRSNIALGDPSLSLEAVIKAAKLAGIHDEIANMPLFYDSVLLDGGASLSGGERQRIALARALVFQPKILFLDEATSSMDSVTERQVQQNLSKLDCTRIVIAHRLSTIREADIIVVLANGELVEHGSHEQLVKSGGEYQRLVEAQIS